jgi:uncharacterized protein
VTGAPDHGTPHPGTDDGLPVFSVMEILSVRVDLPDAYPILTLQESEAPLRQLSFPVGMAEGITLANALRRLSTPRPMTHDLFMTVLQRLNVDVVAVRLVGRAGATYLAELDLMSQRGREIVGCRPTDGITLALRQAVLAPVLADERLFEGSGDVEPIGGRV